MTRTIRSRFVRLRPIVIAAAIILVLAAFQHGSVAPRPAYACWDFECYPGDPVASGCDSSSFVVDGLQTYLIPQYYVQLIYSRGCGANWGLTHAQVCDPGACAGVHLQIVHCEPSLGCWYWGRDAGEFTDDLDHRTVMDSGASSSDRVCLWQWQACTPYY